MLFNLQKLNDYLSFELDHNQVDVLFRTLDSILKGDHCVITGPAGSGKTQMAKALSFLLRDANIKFVTVSPTNKAKLVLSKATNTEAITIHTLLSLSPELDIMELDMKKLKFVSKNHTTLEPNNVWIIDECSMINNFLYQLLIDKAKLLKCTIVFMGDEFQLAPVNQPSVSKVFTLKNVANLNTVYRQDYVKDGKLTPFGAFLEQLRSQRVKHFPRSIEGTTALESYDNASEWLAIGVELFRDALTMKDPGLVRILSYTNQRISKINKAVRKSIGFDNVDFVVGEMLTGYDTVFDLGIENSSDYWIEKVDFSKMDFRGIATVPGYKLHLRDLGNNLKIIFVITPDTDKDMLNNIAALIETLRIRAIKSKQGKDWSAYFSLVNSFAIMEDLVYEGKVVKRKTIDYGYCISVHKSQGSQFNTVLLDAVSFRSCYDPNTYRQLQYVAVSRTMDIIHVYQ